MKQLFLLFAAGCLFASSCSQTAGSGSAADSIMVMRTGGRVMPDVWRDSVTGHKIVKLSRREGDNRSFYFHNNPFLPTPDGKGYEMVFYGSVDSVSQLFTVNLQTYAITQLTHHPGRISGEILGKKRRAVFYQHADSVFATNVEDQHTRLVYVFPEDFKGHINSLNADETLLAGVQSGDEERKLLQKYPQKKDFFNRIYDAHIPHTLFTINLATGALKKIYHEDAWLNHLQFSPVDPNLLLFAHEGPWHKVDRTWLLDLTTGKARLMHKRTVNMEINGHEWWSPDGQTIWFDLQVPRSVNFYVGGADVKTGKESRYQLQRDEWSIHFNTSPDEKLFAGDGGDSTQVAHAKNGMWIYLFRPEGDHFKSERLVDMHYQNYRGLEPNVHFSPDGKWIIFRANFEGKDGIYAVETGG